MDTIGSRLKYYAITNYGGVSKLAVALGITQPRLSQYINNSREIDLKSLQKLIHLGCDARWLLIGEKVEVHDFENITKCNKLLEENALLKSKLAEISEFFLTKGKELKHFSK